MPKTEVYTAVVEEQWPRPTDPSKPHTFRFRSATPRGAARLVAEAMGYPATSIRYVTDLNDNPVSRVYEVPDGITITLVEA